MQSRYECIFCGVSLPLSPRCFLITHFRTLVSYKDNDLLCVPRSGYHSNFAIAKIYNGSEKCHDWNLSIQFLLAISNINFVPRIIVKFHLRYASLFWGGKGSYDPKCSNINIKAELNPFGRIFLRSSQGMEDFPLLSPDRRSFANVYPPSLQRVGLRIQCSLDLSSCAEAIERRKAPPRASSPAAPLPLKDVKINHHRRFNGLPPQSSVNNVIARWAEVVFGCLFFFFERIFKLISVCFNRLSS